MSAYLGPNGSGKSSILDALDKFFNGGDWSINAQAKSEGGITGEDKLPYIVPVFALPKQELQGEAGTIAEILSEYNWNTSWKTTEAIANFYALRDRLNRSEISPDSHYLLVIGRQFQRSQGYLGSFQTDPELQRRLKAADISQEKLDELLEKICSRYSYFYIPVEADPSVFSKLESNHIQKLMDEDIKKKIQEAIGPTTIGSINLSLQQFVSDISNSLKTYKYKGTFKDRLTMNDMIDKVLDAYFSIKILHKTSGGSSIPIRDLSAGEKRRALIDLAHSLLSRNAQRIHRIILAIDEPDASLHASACHDHFSRLAEIPALTEPNSQVLITTHWYGFLPIIQNGIAHSISNQSDKIEFFTFDLYNFREQIKRSITETRGQQPKDIELKSYNDMLQSIVASMVRQPSYNWILCEGLSDKIYLEFYLRDLVEDHNLRILPLGGFKEVRRAYTYLKTPLEDPQYRITGKVLCLVDTDAMLEKVDSKPGSESISFQRIIFDGHANDVKMVKIDDQLTSPATEIEHALQPELFIKTAQSLPPSPSSENLSKIIKNATPIANAPTSYGYLNLTPSANKALMTEFFDVDDNKVLFAKTYVANADHESSPPAWIQSVRDYFVPPARVRRRVRIN